MQGQAGAQDMLATITALTLFLGPNKGVTVNTLYALPQIATTNALHVGDG